MCLGLDEASSVIKPVFPDQLKTLGYELNLKEFEKLWQKYDDKNIGVVKTNQLEEKLLATYDKRSPTNQSRMSVLSNDQSERESSINIERWLAKKFRDGLHDIYHAFKEFDYVL